MIVKWLVQDDVFRENLGPLLSALDSNNSPYYVYKYIPFSRELETPLDADPCVLAYGSLNLIKIIQRTKPWIPGSWCNFEAFRCLNYYAHYGKYLLNKDYAIVPLGELIRQKDELYERFGDPLFVRPDKGDKPFTGHSIAHYEFNSQTRFLLDQPAASPELTVIVSSFKKITREWRFIVSGDRVVTGSLYILNDDFRDRVHTLCESGEAFDFAQSVAKDKWKPDPMFSVDVAETPDGLGLLEINSFSCSGFYAADKNKIVQEANRVAVLEIEDCL